MKRVEEFPEGSSGLVEGPDGPMRRTRANTLAGFTEPAAGVRGTWHMGRNQAYLDEESAWLNQGNAAFLE